MRFVDVVCRFYDGAADFKEEDHPRDGDGRFTTSRLQASKKSTKQFRREHVSKSIKDFYGEELKGRGLTGREAVSKLVQERRGHIKAAFHREDIGDIDLVWGDPIAGLCHVFYRRIQKKQDVQKVINNISNTIANGKRNPSREDDRSYVIEHGTVRVMISKSFKEDGRVRLMISAYEPDGRPEGGKKENLRS